MVYHLDGQVNGDLTYEGFLTVVNSIYNNHYVGRQVKKTKKRTLVDSVIRFDKHTLSPKKIYNTFMFCLYLYLTCDSGHSVATLFSLFIRKQHHSVTLKSRLNNDVVLDQIELIVNSILCFTFLPFIHLPSRFQVWIKIDVVTKSLDTTNKEFCI